MPVGLLAAWFLDAVTQGDSGGLWKQSGAGGTARAGGNTGRRCGGDRPVSSWDETGPGPLWPSCSGACGWLETEKAGPRECQTPDWLGCRWPWPEAGHLYKGTGSRFLT